MKDIVYSFIREHMMMHIVLIALSSAATLGAMAIDFVFGLIKAKKRGEARTSTGYKKTASKAQKYFSPFMVLVFIDLICCVVIPFPVFSMFWAAYCVFCEFKSVREICAVITFVSILQEGDLDSWGKISCVIIGTTVVAFLSVVKEIIMDDKADWFDVLASIAGCVTIFAAVGIGILFNNLSM